MKRRVKSFLVFASIVCLIIIGEKCQAQTPCQIDSAISATLKCRNVPPFTVKLIVAQARLESGNYTNRLYRDHCNLFGMRHPSQRPTKSLGPYATAERRTGYASYKSIQESVEDQLLYLWYIGEKPAYRSTAQYVHVLKRWRYFESGEQSYINNLKFHMKHI